MFKDFKPVLKILLRFVLIYVLLVFLYQMYLNGYKDRGLDSISTWVANQVSYCQNSVGFATKVVEGKPSDETFILRQIFIVGHDEFAFIAFCNKVFS